MQIICYRDFDGDTQVHNYGEIFIGEKFSDLTICVWDKEKGWTSNDGFMLSAPVKDRTEALGISNKLMNSVLENRLELR
jgi:hypothetical protein